MVQIMTMKTVGICIALACCSVELCCCATPDRLADKNVSYPAGTPKMQMVFESEDMDERATLVFCDTGNDVDVVLFVDDFAGENKKQIAHRKIEGASCSALFSSLRAGVGSKVVSQAKYVVKCTVFADVFEAYGTRYNHDHPAWVEQLVFTTNDGAALYAFVNNNQEWKRIVTDVIPVDKNRWIRCLRWPQDPESIFTR